MYQVSHPLLNRTCVCAGPGPPGVSSTHPQRRLRRRVPRLDAHESTQPPHARTAPPLPQGPAAGDFIFNFNLRDFLPYMMAYSKVPNKRAPHVNLFLSFCQPRHLFKDPHVY